MEIQEGDFEIISSYSENKPTINANNGLQNPLFAKEKSQDFFSDLQPKNSIFSKSKGNESTGLSLIQPTLKQKIIYEQLKNRNASKKEFEEFYKYYNKTDNEILEIQEYKEAVEYFRALLNKNDLITLKNFFIMTYRNNFGYGIINQY